MTYRKKTPKLQNITAASKCNMAQYLIAAESNPFPVFVSLAKRKLKFRILLIVFFFRKFF